MPKTNEKDAYFFSHDCNARNDPKILALRSVYGAEGYAVYFMLIEILREQPEYKLAVNKYTWNTLAMQMQVQKEKVQEIIEDCCTEFSDDGKNALLVNDGNYIYSASLLRRMGKVAEVSNIRREAARKRWENKACKISGQDEGKSSPDANAEQKESKEKEKKEKKNICIDANKEKNKQKKKSDVFSDFAANDADLLAALRGFEEMRTKIKKPMTDRARSTLLTELRKLSGDRDEQIAILDQSTANCWQSVYALKTEPQRTGGTRRGGMTTADKMGALGALHEAFSGDAGGRR